MRTGLTLAILLALAATASAQAHTPGFATIDRFDDQTKAEIAASWVGYDATYLGDFDQETFRFDLFGQYTTEAGYGGYAMLALSYAAISGELGGTELEDSGWGASNIELGALYTLRGASFDTILRGGLTLPTATEETDADQVDANALAELTRSRPVDYIMHPVDTSVLRVSASPIVHHGNAFFRIDAGLDVPIDDGAEGDTEGLHTIVRVNLGAGVETGGVALMGEIINLATTDDELEDDEDRFLHFAGVSARYVIGSFQPSLGLQLPLDDDIDQVVDYVVMFGVQYVVPEEKTE